MSQVTVTVPATTANIGPGFDTLGCALSLYDHITFRALPTGQFSFSGCEERFADQNNLALRAFLHTLQELGAPQLGAHIAFDCHIPTARGLGSSAALVCAGVLAAGALSGNTLTKAQALAIATQLEGHPDNAAPALYGGLTATLTEGKTPYAVCYPICEKLRFCALIPDCETRTEDARKILPKQVPYEDAVFNLSRLSVLCRALQTGEEELLRLSLQDRLHQPFRKKLIPEFDLAQKIAYDNGCQGFFISGSGSTCLCLVKADCQCSAIAQALAQQSKGSWNVIPLQADLRGAWVQPLESCE